MNTHISTTAIVPAIGRRLYKGLKDRDCLCLDVFAGEARHIDVKAGAIVSVTNIDGAAAALLTTLVDQERDFTVTPFDLPDAPHCSLDVTTFDYRAMAEIGRSRDADLKRATAIRVFDERSRTGATFLMKMKADATLFVIVPVHRDFLQTGGGGRISIEVKPVQTGADSGLLPAPLGRIRDEWRVASGTAKAYQLKAGQFVQIIDVEGQQCSDFMRFLPVVIVSCRLTPRLSFVALNDCVNDHPKLEFVQGHDALSADVPEGADWLFAVRLQKKIDRFLDHPFHLVLGHRLPGKDERPEGA